MLLGLVEIGRTRPGVVGIDPAGGPSPRTPSISPVTRPRSSAPPRAASGARCTPPRAAPPRRSASPSRPLFAQRIGHGTTLLDDPAIVELVVERGVTIEACPTSNVHTAAIASVDDHPLPRWLAAGVRACVCADNTLLSSTDAREELRRAAAIPGWMRARSRR